MLKADIQLHSAVAYPSWDAGQEPFQQQDFDAQFIILGLKKSFDRLGKRWLGHQGKTYTVNNLDALNDRFHHWAVKRINTFVVNPVLVPIPNSSTTTAIKDYNGLSIAKAISQCGGGIPIYDGLRFKQAMTPASKGGPRDKETIFSNMIAMSPLPKGTPVLIDDVCTLGGHLFAAQRRLGLPNSCHAFVCGRTVKVHQEKMISNRDEPLTAYWG